MRNMFKPPALSIDLKKNRIRIYKRTLYAIGDPRFILLLVNPEDRSIVILSSNEKDQRAFRIPQMRNPDKQYIELNSKALVQNLRSMCQDWMDNRVYRIIGGVFENEGIVKFCISEAIAL